MSTPQASSSAVPLPVAILAGGLATRLRPITETIPKSLVAVADEPFLSHQLRMLKAQGIARVVLCVGHLGAMLEAEYGSGEAWGLELSYSHDGPDLLGTGGAIKRALPLLGDAFFVLYGDSYLPVDYRAVAATWRASGQSALMTVFQNEGAWDTSNVEFSGGRIVRYDKKARTTSMRHIDYGLSIFTRSVFDGMDGAFDLSTLQSSLVQAGRMAGFESPHRFYEIGSHSGLAELDAFLRAAGPCLVSFSEVTLASEMLTAKRLVLPHTITIMPERIGFVGVGRMGANMARRLKDVGYDVTAVYDIYKPAAADLAKEIGAEACTSLARVTELSDVVITVVTDDKAQLNVFSNKKDNLLKGAKGRIFVNCATISPDTHIAVEKLAKKAGARTLEGCMASSISQARAGTLYLMVGGDTETFAKVKPILTKLSDEGKLMRHIGKTGQAAQVKALVNMVMNINTAALAEGLGLADSLKLDLKTVMEVFSQTGANSRVLATDGEDMVNRDHSCFFSSAHAAKDSGIALKIAKKQKLKLPLAAATFAQYTKLTKLGFGELDKSGIAELTFKGRGKAPNKKKK